MRRRFDPGFLTTLHADHENLFQRRDSNINIQMHGIGRQCILPGFVEVSNQQLPLPVAPVEPARPLPAGLKMNTNLPVPPRPAAPPEPPRPPLPPVRILAGVGDL